MIYNRLFHNRFLREEANPDAGGEGNGGGAPPPAGSPDSPSPADPPAPANPYDLSDKGDPVNPDPANPPPSNQEPETPYEIEWGDGFVENDALRQMLAGHAKASGLPPAEAGKFLNEVAASIRADEEAALKEADRSLREDWGSDYETNVASAKAFARKLSKESGVPMEKLGVFASPDGFRLLNAIAATVGEGGLKGGSQTVKAVSPAEEANEMLTNPNHRYYKAIADPSHPQWREATNYYNRLVGISD